MTRALYLLLFFPYAAIHAQQPTDSLKKAPPPNADDPSQFITRVEVYNELQYHENRQLYLNQAVTRVIIKLGKRFTTRVDIPYVYNSIGSATQEQQSGLGDISVRLLGYQLYQRPRSALTASIELSFNTAGSPYLGTGKNLVIPMVTYSLLLPKQKMLFSALFQQANSFSGEESRQTVGFSKLQLIALRYWSKKSWTVLAPEFYHDNMKGGVSMNLRLRMTHAPAPRLNVWVTPSVGVFGDFIGRYKWSVDLGGRYFLFRAS
jgi:hypothetical protein